MKPSPNATRIAAVTLALIAAVFALHLHTPVLASLHVIGIHAGPRVMALTFDDGPDPANTPEILDLLDEYHVKATFFLIGARAAQYPELAREIADRGHAVGSHTWSHPRDVRLLSDHDFSYELTQGADAVQEAVSQPVTLFRPPRGCVDSRIRALARDRGMRTVMWNIAPGKKEFGPPAGMAAHVSDSAYPGAIILMHDGVGAQRRRDVAAARLVLDDMTRRGYRFVTIPELLEQFPHKAR